MGPNTIGRFELVRRIGAGGMGVVYEAIDTRANQRVALKVLLPHAAEEQEGLLRFKREFRALARLTHPSIVRVFDAGIENDVPFIAMEYLEGRDVRAHLRAIPEGPARDRETRRVLRQIFGALAHIHARRIVHRDLKPENILVTSEGRVKLMDFGVARLLRTPSTSSGLLGTFAYMAPEQVTTGEIDGRSDLYAVGVLLYEILTGGYPFPVEPPAAALHHHVNTPAEHVRHVNPGADPTLAALAQRLLEKEPIDRLQSAEEAFPYLADDDGAAPDSVLALPGEIFVPRFVGRQQELETLDGAASDAAAGRGRLILIEGASGMGRSRLIEELRQRIRRRTHVLVAACPRERAPYAAIQTILEAVERIVGRAPEDVVQRILGPDVALLKPIAPKLAARRGPVTIATLDAAQRKVRIHKAIVGIIGRLALTKSVVMVIEDLHFADHSTLELLWDAARALMASRPGAAPGETVCPATLILTRRTLAEGPDHSEALIHRLDETLRLERITLPPIDRGGVAEMLRTMTGAQRPIARAVSELFEGSQGNPLIVQNMIQAWVDDGVLNRAQGAWSFRGERLDVSRPPPPLEADRPAKLPPGLPQDEDSTGPGEAGADADLRTFEGDTEGGSAGSEVEETRRVEEGDEVPTKRADSTTRAPASARAREGGRGPKGARAARGDEVLLTKLNRLPAAARSLLERFSLLGRLLPSDLVAALSGMEEDAFLDAIDDLVRAKILVEDVSQDGVRYRFQQDGFREAVARGLPMRRRAELHLFIAETLERRFRTKKADLAHVLARHWRAGNAPERAVPHLVTLAATASARGDFEGAMRRLEEALAIIDEQPRTAAADTRRLRVLIKQIDLLLEFGRAREALERADPQAAVAARSPAVMACELALRRAASLYALGRIDEALSTLGHIAQPAPTRSLAARLLELEGRMRMDRCEHPKARAVLEAAHDIALDAGLADLAEGLDARVGVVLLHQGDYTGALTKLERGLATARAVGDARSTADFLGHIGLVHAARGNNTEALACYREAIELAEARGVRAELGRWSGELGVLLTHLASFREARPRLEEALQIAEETGSRQGLATWYGELGVHAMLAGEPELAAQALTRSLGIAREIGLARAEAWAEIHLGALALELDGGSVADARDHVEAGLEIADDLGNDELRVIGLLHFGRVRAREGDLAGARATFERADRLALATQNLRLRAQVFAARETL